MTLAKCQVIHDRNQAAGRDKLLVEIRAYGRLKQAWGHGHIYTQTASWKPLGCYVYIMSFYKGQDWWLGVDSSLDGALFNLYERRMSGEYNV